jgi:hypothetical protein
MWWGSIANGLLAAHGCECGAEARPEKESLHFQDYQCSKNAVKMQCCNFIATLVAASPTKNQ